MKIIFRNLNLARIGSVMTLGFVLWFVPAGPAEAGQWCVTMSCPACAKHGFRSSGRECFSSKSACETRVAEVRRTGPSSATYSPCTEEGGSASSGSSGDLMTDSARQIVDGLMRGDSQQFSVGVLGWGVASLLQGPSSDPAEAARKAQEEALVAEQQRQAQIAQDEARHRDLVASLMPVGDGKSSPKTETARQEDPARSTHFTKGYEDASQCYPDNAFGYCVGVRPEEQTACPNDYRAGFDIGDKLRQQHMDEAYRAGEQAGKSGERNGSFTDKRAQGPCRVHWIESYNRGHFNGKNANAKP